MSKDWTPRKSTVELDQPEQPKQARPSRIRRDPVPALKPGDLQLRWFSTEQETWIVVAGVILFALAFAALSIGISQVTSQ